MQLPTFRRQYSCERDYFKDVCGNYFVQSEHPRFWERVSAPPCAWRRAGGRAQRLCLGAELSVKLLLRASDHYASIGGLVHRVSGAQPVGWIPGRLHCFPVTLSTRNLRCEPISITSSGVGLLRGLDFWNRAHSPAYRCQLSMLISFLWLLTM